MHIYVHVPFCARRCSYCDFAIAVRKQVPSDAYVAAVLREWNQWREHPVWESSAEISTVYLGGGTPSRLSSGAVAAILNGIGADRKVSATAEITLEANPDDVTAANAAAWRAAGVNRVSLGVQSFDPAVLAWMHRVHSVQQIYQAVDLVREAGIENLSLDLIFGLPELLCRDWADDLSKAFALEPGHLSLYGLTVEGHTPLGHWTARGEVTPVDEAVYAREFLWAHRELVAHGYDHYEVSNASQPGHRSRHNSAYWQRADFIGLGPSAHSSVGAGRWRQWNLREWAAYQRVLDAGGSAVADREYLDDGAIALEQLYLGLRTREGVDAHLIPEDLVQRWEWEGWSQAGEGRVRLTAEGWLRLDALVASVPLADAPIM